VVSESIQQYKEMLRQEQHRRIREIEEQRLKSRERQR
jgi:hypothetical protein